MGGRQAVRPRPLEPVSKVRILPPSQHSPKNWRDIEFEIRLMWRRSPMDGVACFLASNSFASGVKMPAELARVDTKR